MVNWNEEKEQILTLAYARKFTEAESRTKKLLRQVPKNAEIMGILAGIYIETSRFTQAEILLKKSLRIDPSCLFSYVLLARVKNGQNKWREAIGLLEGLLNKYEKTLTQDMLALIYNLLGVLHKTIGEVDEAAQYGLLASQNSPSFEQKTDNYSNYLFSLNYSNRITDQAVFQAHRNYDTLFSGCSQYRHDGIKPHKKLKIGYISPDFRHHVVVYFVYQLLKQYDREKFEVTCYSRGIEDEVTRDLKSYVQHWRNISLLDAKSAAELIYQDEIDILFDFSGHTKNNVLAILAYKPAPLQVSGIGYFNTTGLKAVDYFLTDQYVDPVGQNDDLFTEKLLRLPDTHFCYTPPSFMPECGEAPFLKNGYITFGSFNNFSKVSDEVLRIWYAIIRQVKGAKLLLKCVVFSKNDCKDMILDRLYQAGFEKEDLDLRPETMPYLEDYHCMDIALDTFPYPGGGTTCEALYMGIPVVTLVGKRHGARFGYSLLKNLQLEECIAFSMAEYVEKAVALAKHKDQLEKLHRELRQRMRMSPIMNGKEYVKNIENIYEKIWQDHIYQFMPDGVENLKQYAVEATARGCYYEVLSCGRKILQIEPKSCEALHAKALAYMHLKQYRKAVGIVQNIIEINDRYIGAYMVLAHVYKRQGRVKDELELLLMVIALLDGIPAETWTRQEQNAYSEAWSMVGYAKLLLGDAKAALECALRSFAAEQNKTDQIAEYSNCLFVSNYISELTNEERFELHLKYQEIFKNVDKCMHFFPKEKTKLRIGYISPDLKQHPVMYFSMAMFSRFDQDRFEVFAYHNGTPDLVTAQVKCMVSQWRQIQGMDTRETARLILEDQIDILVDLSGHTAHSCLPILAYKPAPVQLCGIGYFHTTGLDSVDYFIGDVHLDQEGEEAFFSEQILRLPNSHFCYCAGSAAPECAAVVPSIKKGYTTFGCFNNFAKVNDNVMRVWRKILTQVDNSRLILKSKDFSSLDVREAAYQRLEKAGIPRNQVELRGFSKRYLREYEDVDIALDPFPYTGGAITCAALYMGVPVLTLCGNRHGARFGYSILKNVGLEDWIAVSEDEYIAKAVTFAQDYELLQHLRQGLRTQMLASPLMDETGYMRELEKQYWRIWENYHTLCRARQIDLICDLWKRKEFEAAWQVAGDLYEADHQHPDTVYAFAYLLYQAAEKEMALEVLRQYPGKEEHIVQLIREIENG